MANPRILIVDDDDAFRTILQESLSQEGYDVHQSSSGRDAQKWLQQDVPDIILLDIMMPDIDGVTLCREIRANPSMGDIPIVVISALGDSQTVSDAMLFGATDFVVKPIDITVMKIKIQKALRQAESRRRTR